MSMVRSYHPLRAGLIFYENKDGLCHWLSVARRIPGVGSVVYLVGRISLWAGRAAPSPTFSGPSIVSRVVVSLVSVHVGLVHWFLLKIQSTKHA